MHSRDTGLQFFKSPFFGSRVMRALLQLMGSLPTFRLSETPNSWSPPIMSMKYFFLCPFFFSSPKKKQEGESIWEAIMKLDLTRAPGAEMPNRLAKANFLDEGVY